MAQERKKAEPKPIVKLEPKKRVQTAVEEKPKKEVKVEPIVEPIVEEQSEAKVKRSENKYVRLSLEAKADEKFPFLEKVKSGELKYAFYAIDGDKGYHYYLVTKKQK